MKAATGGWGKARTRWGREACSQRAGLISAPGKMLLTGHLTWFSQGLKKSRCDGAHSTKAYSEAWSLSEPLVLNGFGLS